MQIILDRIRMPFVRRVLLTYKSSRTDEKAAALTFHLLVALMPVAVLLVLVGSSLLGIAETKQWFVEAATRSVGSEAAQFAAMFTERLIQFEPSIFTSTFMFAVILFSAIGFFDRLQYTLSSLLRVPFIRPRGVWDHVVDYAKCFVYFLFLCSAILAFFALQIFLTLLLRDATILPELSGLSTNVLTTTVMLLLSVVLYAIIYRVFVRDAYPWAVLQKGAVTGALLFAVVNSLFSVVLAQSVTMSLYGVAGSLLAFVLWMYYVVQTLLIGAVVAYESRPQE